MSHVTYQCRKQIESLLTKACKNMRMYVLVKDEELRKVTSLNIV